MRRVVWGMFLYADDTEEMSRKSAEGLAKTTSVIVRVPLNQLASRYRKRRRRQCCCKHRTRQPSPHSLLVIEASGRRYKTDGPVLIYLGGIFHEN